MWMISFLRYIWSLMLSSFFPSYCFVCKKEGNTICTECLQRLSLSIDTPYPFIISVYSFKNQSLKKIIHAIKYFHRKDLIPPITRALIEKLKTNKDEYSSYCLVPIPMPLLRQYSRGHNHTESIARQIEKETGILLHTTLLKRITRKKRQVMTSSRQERINNQKGSFIVTGQVAGLSIILIDDVTTTGATLKEARKVLLSHGASNVCAYTIAH